MPAVTWWRNRSELIDQTSETDEEREIVHNELVIEALKREDLLTQFVCQASNTNLTKPATAYVEVNISCKSIFPSLLILISKFKCKTFYLS